MKQRFASLLLCLLTLFFVIGCATPQPGTVGAQLPSWSGRLSVRVDAAEALASQSFSSAFDLQGDAQRGQLHFYTPLGSTAAAITWTPEQASLRSGNDSQSFSSIDALIAQVLGTPVPVAALFAWLAGEPTSPDGWQVDQSQWGSGKITARRSNPAPRAEIRVILEP